MDNTIPVAPSNPAEVDMAIQRLKFNKVSGYDGLVAELFKAGADELVSYKLEGMPSGWSLSLLCPLLKNSHKL